MNPFKECTTDREVTLEYKRLRNDLEAERNAPYKDRFAQLRNQQKNRKAEIKKKLDRATIEKVKDWQEGEKIYMDKLSKMDLDIFSEGLPHYNNFHDVDHGHFYHYQPKKQHVWLRFTKKQVTESQWHDSKGNPLQPFYLSDVRRHNLRRTDV